MSQETGATNSVLNMAGNRLICSMSDITALKVHWIDYPPYQVTTKRTESNNKNKTRKIKGNFN